MAIGCAFGWVFLGFGMSLAIFLEFGMLLVFSARLKMCVRNLNVVFNKFLRSFILFLSGLVALLLRVSFIAVFVCSIEMVNSVLGSCYVF